MTRCFDFHIGLNEDFDEHTVSLLFDDRDRRRSFNVPIINDSGFESEERFTLVLNFSSHNMLPRERVVFEPNETTINIIDDDSE